MTYGLVTPEGIYTRIDIRPCHLIRTHSGTLGRFEIRLLSRFILDLWSSIVLNVKKSKYNFLYRIFVTVFFVEIFNFFRYSNSTTCDITLHNEPK